MAKKKILIIDDEQNYVEILKERLEFEGFDIEVAYDGKTGLDLMRNNVYKVVLLDIMMPDLNGFGVKDTINIENHNLSRSPVIFVTAYGRMLSDKEKKIVGNTPFLHKPFDIGELLNLIKNQKG